MLFIQHKRTLALEGGGIHNANKQFLMAAIAYNLKKYLKYETKINQPQRGEQHTLAKYIKQAVLKILGRKTAFLALCLLKPTEIYFRDKINLIHT